MIRVLIVEDEEFIRKGLVHTMDWLKMDCLVVGEAENGEEGYEKILQMKPDLVLTDIRMPKLDGITMIEKAKKVEKFHSILLTSYAEFEYAKRAITVDVSSYLLKPVSEKELEEAVERVRMDLRQYKNPKEEEKNPLLREMEEIMAQGSATNYYVVETIKAITKEYGSRISIETVSSQLGVSPSYLSRKFKEVTGKTFLEVLHEYRIIQSAKLLATGKYRVGEVADLSGFSDYKHFYSVFKKYTGIAPTEYTKG
ncbi:response regulator transcription factor [Proteiniclasticum ruminis]|uniref:Stage 0 sporulation protein A homolog n=1 Tax=Proteiniclasticum ruminis TaxID=398199 RepID=A0A1I5E3W3_9CLOT|nr:response regulator [Proteiniclasticum ruminis]SFO05970.1 two-component system, response regulator YesN [Proteiniclasticum ruminis]